MKRVSKGGGTRLLLDEFHEAEHMQLSKQSNLRFLRAACRWGPRLPRSPLERHPAHRHTAYVAVT